MEANPMKRYGGGVPFMKENNPTQNLRQKDITSTLLLHTHTHTHPLPEQPTANTVTAGCSGSLGATLGQGTRKEHLPVSLQSHSALGQ